MILMTIYEVGRWIMVIWFVLSAGVVLLAVVNDIRNDPQKIGYKLKKILRVSTRIIGFLLAVVGIVIIVGDAIPKGLGHYVLIALGFIVWLLFDLNKEREEEIERKRDERLLKLCGIIRDMPRKEETMLEASSFYEKLKNLEEAYDMDRRIKKKQREDMEEIMNKYR